MKHTFDWEKAAADRGIFVRKCSICGKPMIDGYCVDDGMDYYCSDDCLHMGVYDRMIGNTVPV